MGLTAEKIITLEQAKALGLDRYFTGSPCSRGEVYFRSVARRHCLCARCEQHELERKRKYYQDNKTLVAQKNAEWNANNKEKRLQLKRAWKSKNKPKVAEEKKRYRANNRESYLEQRRAYRLANPQHGRASRAIERAKKRQRVPAWFSELDLFALKEAASLCLARSEHVGGHWHVDHMVPLNARRASGLHVAANLQVIPESLNRLKGNRMILTRPDEWLAYLDGNGAELLQQKSRQKAA